MQKMAMHTEQVREAQQPKYKESNKLERQSSPSIEPLF